MPIPIASTLKINGVPVDRDAADVTLESLLLFNPEGPDTLEFTHHASTTQAYLHRSEVRLEVDEGGPDPVLRFRGRITDAEERLDGAPGWSYRCQGGSWLADLVSVSHPQRGVGQLTYNAPPDDQDYDPGLVGLTVGAIIEEVLTIDRIASDLWRAGVEAYTAAPVDPVTGYDTIGTDPPVLKADTLADLALMTTVPLEAIRFTGQRLWSQVMDFVRTYAPTRRLRIHADGTIRVVDTRTVPVRALVVGTDAIRLPEFRRDSGDCATAVRVRGRDLAEGMWFTLVDGDLIEDWTEEEESLWTWADFERPEAAYAAVDITALGTDTVTVEVTDGLDAWPANYWPGIQAHITLIADAASGNIEYQITRRIVANTALSTGGTSVITLDVALPVGAGYNRAIIVGIATGSRVHRRYRFATDRQDAARRITRRFPFPVATAQSGADYIGALVTSVPFGWNVRQAAGFNVGQVFPLQFSIFTDPDDNLVKLITAEPTVKPWSTPDELELGGDAVTKPDDIRVFVPVSKGPLEARIPPADDTPPWEGRCYDIHGLEYEAIIDLDGWTYIADQGRAEALARDLLDSLKDPIISGSIEVFGYDADAVLAGGREAIELDAVAAFDALDVDIQGVPLPVQSVEVRWQHAPGSPTTVATTIHVSTRTFPAHGERHHEPRGYVDGPGASGAFGDLARSFGFFDEQGG